MPAPAPHDKAPGEDPLSTALHSASFNGLLQPAPPLWPHFLTGQDDAPVRVLLLDDDAFMRRVIAQELLADRRIQLQAQGASVRDGRRLLASEPVDVLMLDLHLADGNASELIREAHERHSRCEVIVISQLGDDTHVLQALELGATGYLLKNAWMQSFAQAVLQVVNGGAALTPWLSRRLIRRISQQPQQEAAAPIPSTPWPVRESMLTTREREVLRCVAQGHGSKEIGERLGISGQTVNAHIKNIYKKLRVHTRAQAVGLATHTGQL